MLRSRSGLQHEPNKGGNGEAAPVVAAAPPRRLLLRTRGCLAGRAASGTTEAADETGGPKRTNLGPKAFR